MPDVILESPTEIKSRKFTENPDNFICIDDVILGAIRSNNGSIGIMHGVCKRTELEIALTRVNYKTNSLFMMLDTQNAMQKSENGIIK